MTLNKTLKLWHSLLLEDKIYSGHTQVCFSVTAAFGAVWKARLLALMERGFLSSLTLENSTSVLFSFSIYTMSLYNKHVIPFFLLKHLFLSATWCCGSISGTAHCSIFALKQREHWGWIWSSSLGKGKAKLYTCILMCEAWSKAHHRLDFCWFSVINHSFVMFPWPDGVEMSNFCVWRAFVLAPHYLLGRP